MTSSIAPSFSETSTALMVLASAARAWLATARAPQRVRLARRSLDRVMGLLLEIERRFLGEAEHGLRLFLGAVGAHGELGHHDLTRADGGDGAAVLPHARPAADRVADAVGGLDHRHGVLQTDDHGAELELLELELAERGRAAGRERPPLQLQLGEEAPERIPLPDGGVGPLRRLLLLGGGGSGGGRGGRGRRGGGGGGLGGGRGLLPAR